MLKKYLTLPILPIIISANDNNQTIISNQINLLNEKYSSIQDIIGRQDRILDNFSNDITFYSVLLTVLMLAFTVLSAINSKNEARHQAKEATEELKNILKEETDVYIKNWIKNHASEEITAIRNQQEERMNSLESDAQQATGQIHFILNSLFDKVSESMTQEAKEKIIYDIGSLEQYTIDELLNKVDIYYNNKNYNEAHKVASYLLKKNLNKIEEAKTHIYLGKLSSYINQKVNKNKEDTYHYNLVINMKSEFQNNIIDDKLLYEILLAQHFRTGRRIIIGDYDKALDDSKEIIKFQDYAYNEGEYKIKIFEIVTCAMINQAIVYDYKYDSRNRDEIIKKLDKELKFITNNIALLNLFKRNLQLKLETAFQYRKNTFFIKKLNTKYLHNEAVIDIFNLLEEEFEHSKDLSNKTKNLKEQIIDYDFSNLRGWAIENDKKYIKKVIDKIGYTNDFKA